MASRDNGDTLTDAGEVLLRLKGVSGAMVELSDLSLWMDLEDTGTAGLWARGSAQLLVEDGLVIA